MLSQDKARLLQAFLGSLPQAAATRLAGAVEVDRLMDGAVLPHELILSSLRPALRRTPGARMPTPLRLFCLAFEDILTTETIREKQKACIARASVTPIWRWVSETLMPAEAKAYAAEIRNLVLARKRDDAAASAARFCAIAAARMQAAFADAAQRPTLRRMFGSDVILADAEEAALLMSVAPQILEIQTLLPKPLPALTENFVHALRDIYDRFVETNLDAAPYVAVIAMNRLARPWEALRIPLAITRQTQDTLISKTDMGLVGEILFHRIEALQNAIIAARHPNFDVEQLLASVMHFAELSSAIVKEIEVRRDGTWGQRLLKDRVAVGNIMDGFMDRAVKEINAALPVQKSGSFAGGPKYPDFSRLVEPDKIECALRYARLIVGCRAFAPAASFGAKQKNAHEEATAIVRRYTEDLVKEMRSAEGPRREIVDRQFALVTKLTALLFSEEEAEFLRRRGRAAAPTIAA